jgi:hypothetical protein
VTYWDLRPSELLPHVLFCAALPGTPATTHAIFFFKPHSFQREFLETRRVPAARHNPSVGRHSIHRGAHQLVAHGLIAIDDGESRGENLPIDFAVPPDD